MEDKSFMTTKEELGYAQEHIINEKKEIQNYSLSNNLDDIKIAIFDRTGLNIDLEKAHWIINNNTPVSIKHLMNKHRVIYSMTISQEEEYKYLFIYMRVNDKWFITKYSAIGEEFISLNQLHTYNTILKLAKRTLLDDIDC